MKILSVGNFSNPSWDGSIPDEEHIAQALEELGYEVFRQQREEEIYKIPDNLDFVLIAQYDNYGAKINNLKSYTKCPLVYWAFDYQADGQEWHEQLVKQSDLYLSKRIADSKYPNWQWLSQDFAPSFLDKAPVVEKDIDILFTGSYLPWATERNETIKAVGEKYNLVIHSVNEWPQGNQGPVMDDALPALYARAKIVLSIDHTLEAGYWSDRNAQAMACGAFVLFRYVPLSETVFRNHVQYFYSVEDCLEQIEWLLKEDDYTLVMADAGYRYARNYLKVKDTVFDLLTIVRSIV